MLTKTTKSKLKQFVDTEFEMRDIVGMLELVETVFQEDLQQIKRKAEKETDKQKIRKHLMEAQKLYKDYHEVLDVIEDQIDSVQNTIH